MNDDDPTSMRDLRGAQYWQALTCPGCGAEGSVHRPECGYIAATDDCWYLGERVSREEWSRRMGEETGHWRDPERLRAWKEAGKGVCETPFQWSGVPGDA